MQQVGGLGHVPPENLRNLEAMRLLLRQFFVPRMLLGGHTTEFYTHEYLTFCLLLKIAAFHWLIPQATSFAVEACETNRSKNGNLLEDSKEILSQPSRIMFQHVTTLCASVGVYPALALFGDAKQTMGEGKSGLVETGLAGLVATAL